MSGSHPVHQFLLHASKALVFSERSYQGIKKMGKIFLMRVFYKKYILTHNIEVTIDTVAHLT